MSLLVTGMIMFYAAGVDVYAPTGYNDSVLQNFSKSLDAMNDTIQDTRNNLSGVGAGSTGVIDVIGGVFQSGYVAAKTVLSSVTTMFGITTTAVDTLPVGGFARPLITALTVLIIIAVFIGVFLHIITKSDRV